MNKDQSCGVKIIFLLTLIGIVVALVFTSCSSIRKLRMNVHQETVKTENTQKTDTKDSTTKTIIKTVDSSGITVTVVYDSTENSNAETTLDIVSYPAKSGDYESGFKIKSSVKPKSVQITSHNKKIEERQKEVSVNEAKEVVKNTSVKTVNTVKIVEKKKLKLSGFMIGIGLAVAVAIVLLLKNRKKIWTWIKLIISPIKF